MGYRAREAVGGGWGGWGGGGSDSIFMRDIPVCLRECMRVSGVYIFACVRPALV